MKRGYAIAVGIVLTTAPLLLLAFSSGPPPGTTGAPGDSLCTRCHLGTANSGGGSAQVVFPEGLVYTPGVRQQWTVRITDSAARVFGFQLTVRLASNEAAGQAGELAPTDASTQVVRSGQLQFIQHTRPAAAGTFSLTWTPPAQDVGPVRVYVAGNAANGDGRNTGDQTYTANYTLNPAAPPQPPTLPSENAVVNGASFQAGIAAGSWVTIFGRNLAPATRTWRPEEIVNGKLPTALDGVSVTVNNRPAAVYYISPTQLNVQAPDDDALGVVEVRVRTPQGTSNPATAELQRFAPAFFVFEPQGRKYVAAVHADGTLLGPPGLFTGAVTRPAAPGETILLFGTGFGATDPAVPAGQVVTQAARLANSVQIRFGDVPATVSFAGLAPQAAGLYQFNVVVPNLPDGDVSITAEVGGVRTQAGVTITIKR